MSAHPSHRWGSIGSSAEGPSARAHMRPPRSFWHTVHTFRDPMGSSTEGPGAPRPHAPTTPMSAHPSHVPWPHRELHRK
eukprot:8341238-Pyramimonas_sp.AAC.1